ncbi:hypothetical protein [uncultured Arthrobacter sp.]|nr:hypothetical protein [uncultured Arthrobacter sp.]
MNDATGVTFSVDDSKDERYAVGYTPADEPESKAPAKRSTSSKSSK